MVEREGYQNHAYSAKACLFKDDDSVMENSSTRTSRRQHPSKDVNLHDTICDQHLLELQNSHHITISTAEILREVSIEVRLSTSHHFNPSLRAHRPPISTKSLSLFVTRNTNTTRSLCGKLFSPINHSISTFPWLIVDTSPWGSTIYPTRSWQIYFGFL